MSSMAFHTELMVFICLSIGCLLIYGIYLYKAPQPLSKSLRRLIFVLIALFGLALLILKPDQTKRIDKYNGYIGSTQSAQEHSYTSIHELLSQQPERYDSVLLDPKHSSIADLEIGSEQFSMAMIDSNSWGIIDLSIPNRIVEKEPWQLSGRVSSNTQSVRIRNQFSDEDENANVEGGEFSVSTSTAFAGHQLYDLVAYDELGDSMTYTIAVEVVSDEPWQLMALTSFPSFELNALKNYWIEEGNGFFWRTSVSTGRYRTSSVNTSLDELETLHRKALQAYDFLLIDIPSWNQLSPQERNTINGQISSQGLGLIIVPTDVNQQAIDISHPAIVSYSKEQGSSTASHYNFGTGWRSIQSGSASLGRYQDYGLGRRLILSYDQTYQYILADQDDQYDRIWSSLLNVAYNSYLSTSKILADQWIWSGERTELYLITDQPISGDILLNDSIQVLPAENPLIEHTYQLTLWPESGYNTLSYNDVQLRFYAYNAVEWPLVRTRQLIKASAMTEASQATDSYEYHEAYPPVYGLILLVLGLGLLWLDERLYQ